LVLDCYLTSWDSAVGIATDYGLDGWGVAVWVLVGARIFSSPHCPDQFWGPTQPPIQWVPGAVSSGVKWLAPEVYHSPPASGEVKNAWIYISSPPSAFRA
jgi:hypothetical protein